MCERFAQVWDEELGWFIARWTGPQAEEVHGVARRHPSKDSYLGPRDPVGLIVKRGAGAVLEWVQWGFQSPRELTINVPLSEALRTDPWRDLLDRRGVVPMTGFYEWGAEDGLPYFFRRRDGSPLLVAAVCDVHEDGTPPCAGLLTAPAPEDVADVQGQLPLVLDPDEVGVWLDTGVSADEAARRVGTPSVGTLHATLVTGRPGEVRARAPGRSRASAVADADGGGPGGGRGMP